MRPPVLSVVVPPADVIPIAIAKAHLRVETGDDDALIVGLIEAVAGEIDGATGWLGRALGMQTLLLTAGHFPGQCCDGDSQAVDWSYGRTWWWDRSPAEMRLPCPPVQAVSSVVYIDPDGVTQTADPSTYALSDRIVFPVGGASWPATCDRPDAVQVTYVAGYPPDDLPATIRAAMLLRIGALYGARNDDAAIVASRSDALLAPWRVFA